MTVDLLDAAASWMDAQRARRHCTQHCGGGSRRPNGEDLRK
jgi:hypothetical protein